MRTDRTTPSTAADGVVPTISASSGRCPSPPNKALRSIAARHSFRLFECLEGVGEAGRGALPSLGPLAALPNRRRFFVNLLRGVRRFGAAAIGAEQCPRAEWGTRERPAYPIARLAPLGPALRGAFIDVGGNERTSPALGDIPQAPPLSPLSVSLGLGTPPSGPPRGGVLRAVRIAPMSCVPPLGSSCGRA